MELPSSVREINLVVDRIARGQAPGDEQGFQLAAALGLAWPDGRLTEIGKLYAQPHLGEGPAAQVMGPERRDVAELLLSGSLPLQASLRRMLEAVVHYPERLVPPAVLELPEGLLRPYLNYLLDLGLVCKIGPFVEATQRGARAAALPAAEPEWRAWVPPAAGVGVPVVPSFQDPPFRYGLIRRVCMSLIAMRGQRDWSHLQPLLDGPLVELERPYAEWLLRFRSAVPGVRRTWMAQKVAEFEHAQPYPAWFGPWCHALLGADPKDALERLVGTASLLRAPVVVRSLPSREAWLFVTALQWAARRGRGVIYPEAVDRFAWDGIHLPPWREMHGQLEEAGILVADQPATRLLMPVQVEPPEGALWPYAGQAWVAAALFERQAFSLPEHPRRSLQM